MRSYVRWVNGRHALFGVQAGRDVIIGGSLTTDMSVVPDYVFEAGYPLMPLVELEAFVKQEKHLPNVPSAEEIGKVNMTELQMKLLEKIEELTLYTLQQKDRIRTLLQRLEAVDAGRITAHMGATSNLPRCEDQLVKKLGLKAESRQGGVGKIDHWIAGTDLEDWYLVLATSEKRWSQPFEQFSSFSFTNPIFVDVEGNRYFDPPEGGYPLQPIHQ